MLLNAFSSKKSRQKSPSEANLITYSATVKSSSGQWRTACSLLDELPKVSLQANIILRGAVMKSLQAAKARMAHVSPIYVCIAPFDT